jgi:hypothetical protein
MELAQLTALKVAVLADPALVAVGRNDTELARLLNLPTTFVVWRTSISRRDCQAQGFDWTQADNLTTGQARIWDWLFDGDSQTMNPSEPGKRAGISECWKGTAAKVANATFVLGRCKRFATRAEQILGSGTGTEGTPATLGFEGSVGIGDIGDMWNHG